jgi:hypothetical protein
VFAVAHATPLVRLEQGVQTKQVFIASIGRNHKTEKARMTTALERDMNVLASIDATA